MIQRGFAEAATKKDLERLTTKEELDGKMNELDGKIDSLEQTMKDNFRLVREEIKMLNFTVKSTTCANA